MRLIVGLSKAAKYLLSQWHFVNLFCIQDVLKDPVSYIRASIKLLKRM
jgi:hypothetical protein